ncbi:MAG: vWA domain-containing protein [Bdellovibrionota bacterium]
MKMKNLGLWLSSIVSAALPLSAVAAEAPAIVTQKPHVDVVFVLDTTGSMSGLIQAAKEKIWAVASTLAQTKPTPEIRMGLVGYRDRGDDYVTRVTDLTTDLDSVYSQLMAFEAGGGGDEPESVNQALSEAVSKISWRSDADTYKVIFLVGDAPPHMDYQDDRKYESVAADANKKGIVLNAIQCGSMASTTPFWQKIALLGEGKYFQVAQDGHAVLAATPYDSDLAKLSSDLDDTRLPYGSAREQSGQKGKFALSKKIAAAAPTSAVAQRTALSASDGGAANFLGEKELVNDVAEGKADLRTLKSEELPEELKNLPLEKQSEIVQTKAERRKELQAQIRKLADQRQQYLADKVSKDRSAERSLDSSIYDAVKTQAATKGIQYSTGPRY